MKVAILQSSYIPWKGYFDIIHDVDVFVFYDDVQFTRRDWRSRNRIKSSQGSVWLSVPTHGDRSQLIHDVHFADPKWAEVHWKSLTHAYGRAPFFGHYREFFADLYLGRQWTLLSEFNQTATMRISRELLGITTTFADSRDLMAEGVKKDRIMDLVRKTGATSYLSGPAARDATGTARGAARLRSPRARIHACRARRRHAGRETAMTRDRTGRSG